jgi:predicted GIY-YIG superfamily endonuclease
VATPSMAARPTVGTVYLLHFAHPYYHARHYAGFSTNLDRRIGAHRRGRGARLMQAVVHAEIAFIVVRTWDGVTRAFERRLHRSSHLPQMCPICARDRIRPVIPRRNPGTGGMT